MPIAPLSGPHGLYNVSALPRFLLDSRNVGWQGAYFTDVDGVAEGTVDQGHARYCIQRGMHHEARRQHGSKDWHEFATGFSLWRAGDEQHFDWRRGGRSQFLFIAPEVAESVLGDDRVLPPLGHQSPLRSRLLELVFDALEADLAQGSPGGPLVGESLIAALVANLAGRQAPKVDPTRSACDRAMAYLEARFAEPVTLQDLADASGLGQRQLCRAFRDATGLSPHQYLLRKRVDQAKMLISRDHPLAEVALQCGFADQSQLTRTFVRHVGTTPGRYRTSGTR
jgi:AraC family transcriptional regulator